VRVLFLQHYVLAQDHLGNMDSASKAAEEMFSIAPKDLSVLATYCGHLSALDQPANALKTIRKREKKNLHRIFTSLFLSGFPRFVFFQSSS
jgi:hypothetical protein